MIRMQLSRILIRELMDYQVIELREVLDDLEGDVADAKPRTFPIVIGLPEAQAIERRLAGIEIKRPQTHDLLASVIETMGGELFAIEVNDLADNTFFARLRVRTTDGTEHEIDSRPSDAIALGAATGVPIFVAEHVIDAATAAPEPETPDDSHDEDTDDDEDMPF